MVNPNKYTKYDLSDVSKDQMSDRSNSRAAFDFLRQLKDRKNDDDDQEEKGGKVSFKQPPSKKSIDQEASTSSSNVVHVLAFSTHTSKMSESSEMSLNASMSMSEGSSSSVLNPLHYPSLHRPNKQFPRLQKCDFKSRGAER